MPDERATPRGPGRAPWPTSAIVSVALCAVLVALLAILNLLGVQVGSGSYRAEVGGTAAEWFSGVATLVALPAAVVVGLRQARAQSEATAFERQRAHAERANAERLATDAAGDGGAYLPVQHTGDARPDGLIYLRVGDIGPVAAEFGAEVHDSGARHEVSLVDPDGNRVRVGAPTGRTEPGYTYPS